MTEVANDRSAENAEVRPSTLIDQFTGHVDGRLKTVPDGCVMAVKYRAKEPIFTLGMPIDEITLSRDYKPAGLGVTSYRLQFSYEPTRTDFGCRVDIDGQGRATVSYLAPTTSAKELRLEGEAADALVSSTLWAVEILQYDETFVRQPPVPLVPRGRITNSPKP